MLGSKEKLVTRVSLEFLNHIIPVFEKFLLLFQKSCLVVHILCDNLCDILIKLLRRFIKPKVLKTSMSQISHLLIIQSSMCLTTVIGGSTRKVPNDLTADQQKIALLGMRSFFKAKASYLKEKLPLGNELRQLECLNPTKRHKQSTVLSIQNIASVLQPKIKFYRSSR